MSAKEAEYCALVVADRPEVVDGDRPEAWTATRPEAHGDPAEAIQPGRQRSKAAE